jgi:hypothetical protein
MKKYIALVFIACFSFVGCQKDILDKEPLDLISDATVWGDAELTKAYITKLYSGLLIEDNGPLSEYHFMSTFAGESTGAYSWLALWPLQGGMDADRNYLDYWDYGAIRRMNFFFEQMETSDMEESIKARYIGEVRFLRAYAYFMMVKRYGGVPLITIPQEIITDVKELMLPRNTEHEIYDFIATELDLAADILPETYAASDRGRVTTYAALALKSRAMLYAGSIAKYDTRGVLLDGVVGIPAAKAVDYFQASYDASKAIIESGEFSLYKKYLPDHTKNYRELFLDEENEEVVFSKKFLSPDLTHNYNFWIFPLGFQSSWGYGGLLNPLLEFVEAYENTDGTLTPLEIKDGDGNPIYYSDPTKLYEGKDPRLNATVLYQGAAYRGETMQTYSGIYDASAGKVVAEPNGYLNGLPHIGKSGIDKNGDATRTGYYVLKKMSNDNVEYDEGDTDVILFRLGEMYLNLAEAALELNKSTEALSAINEIRNRAGIVELSEIDMDKIRHERRIELSFEGHRFWDLRRWRIADEELSEDRHGLKPIYHSQNDAFYFEKFTERTTNRKFDVQHYYLSLTKDKINNSSKLVENPGY